MLLKRKSSYFNLPAAHAHQWLPVTLHATSKISACPTSLHQLLGTSLKTSPHPPHLLVSCPCSSYLRLTWTIPQVHSFFTLLLCMMAHSLTSFRSLLRDISPKRLFLTLLSEQILRFDFNYNHFPILLFHIALLSTLYIHTLYVFCLLLF